jgi:F-type H+-transporting ATPase subunit epsilon
MPFQLAIVTPERTVVDEPVDAVVVPGVEGEFGVLPEHEAFLSALDAGVIHYRAGGQEHRVAISTGFAEVTGNHVTVLARTAEHAHEIDRARAEAARDRASDGLRQTGLPQEELVRLNAASRRASARLLASVG